MKIALVIVALLIAGGAIAATITPQIGGGISQFDGGIAKQGAVSGGGGGTNFMLMTDGTSRILQTDGTSRMCQAGGC